MGLLENKEKQQNSLKKKMIKRGKTPAYHT
jgi:hypothetical protein